MDYSHCKYEATGQLTCGKAKRESFTVEDFSTILKKGSANTGGAFTQNNVPSQQQAKSGK